MTEDMLEEREQAWATLRNSPWVPTACLLEFSVDFMLVYELNDVIPQMLIILLSVLRSLWLEIVDGLLHGVIACL